MSFRFLLERPISQLQWQEVIRVGSCIALAEGQAACGWFHKSPQHLTIVVAHKKRCWEKCTICLKR